MLYHSFALVAASVASAVVIRPRDPGFQEIPTSAQADNTFSNGAPMLAAEPPDQAGLPVPDVYGVRNVDLPFGRLYHGKMKFFSKGQLNTPDKITDHWITEPGVTDSAKQSACGIPDNAFSISKVAIHPYFLKYADLSRYCMQDVCISFWNGKTGPASSDMILKVTDVCSTDPDDPTHCATPGDIKIDRTKAKIMEKLTDKPNLEYYPQLKGSEFTDGDTYWFFMKCWADALVQPAYTDNWFAKPALPNNLHWAQTTQADQWKANNASYPIHGWPTYDNNAYKPQYDDETSPPIPDWAPGDPEPEWCPVAGGKGWGNPTGKNCGGSQQVKPASGGSSSAAVVSSTAVVSSASKVASTFGSPSSSTSSTSAMEPVVTNAVADTPSSSSSSSTSSTSAMEPVVTNAVADTPSSSSSSSTSSTSAMEPIVTNAVADTPSSTSSTSATSTTAPAVFPGSTVVSNSTSGVSPGMNGAGQANPKQGPVPVVEDPEDECEW